MQSKAPIILAALGLAIIAGAAAAFYMLDVPPMLGGQ